MHLAAFLYVDEQAADLASTTGVVVECGSRNVNGTVRDLFPLAQYCGVDVEPGSGVDIECDFRKIALLVPAEVVVCCEVLEHDSDPESLLAKAYEILRPGGRLIMTCAGEGRPEHSAVDGGPLRDGEHYRNIDRVELYGWLRSQGWSDYLVNVLGDDTRCVATK